MESAARSAQPDRSTSASTPRWQGARYGRNGFFAVFDRQAEAIRCAVEIVEGVREIGLEVRAGLHVGEAELIGGKVGGVAVHTGAGRRDRRAGRIRRLLCPESLVPGAGIDFQDLGDRRLKGVPEEVRLWAVRSVKGVDLAQPLEPAEAAERWESVPVRLSTRTARVVGAVVGLSVVAGLIGFLVLAPDEPAPEAPIVPIQPNTLIRIDPASMEIDARYELSAVPKGVVFAAGRCGSSSPRKASLRSSTHHRRTPLNEQASGSNPAPSRSRAWVWSSATASTTSSIASLPTSRSRDRSRSPLRRVLGHRDGGRTRGPCRVRSDWPESGRRGPHVPHRPELGDVLLSTLWTVPRGTPGRWQRPAGTCGRSTRRRARCCGSLRAR